VDDGSVHSVSRSALVLSVSRPNRIDRLLDLICLVVGPPRQLSIRIQILRERPLNCACGGRGNSLHCNNMITRGPALRRSFSPCTCHQRSSSLMGAQARNQRCSRKRACSALPSYARQSEQLLVQTTSSYEPMRAG
jgi:hypothetical protein